MPERFFIPVDRPQGNDGTPLLTRTAARHTARLFAALRPLIGSLGKELRSLLLARPYDVAQIRAFLAISPLAAARAGSTAVFLEQVREQARILAGWNVPDEEVRDTLREFDAVTGRALGGRHAPQREQLQLATLLVLNQAYYEFRETEAQALFGFDRAELDSESLEDRLGRVVRILTKAVRARAGRLVLTERLPDRRLARALYI